ncbi:MAG: transglycosylase SLT domain-containing protein [Parcubacteria group bacterium]
MRFFETFNQPKNTRRIERPKNVPVQNDSEKGTSENAFDRRGIMKIAGGTLLAAVAAKLLEKPLIEKFIRGKDFSDGAAEDTDRLRTEYREADRKAQLEKAKRYIDIDSSDNEVIGKTFREQIEKRRRITLDKTTRSAIFHQWQKEHTPGSFNYQQGIVQGLERMAPWMDDITKIFQHYGVPEKFIYLAIAESYFQTKNVSEAGAVGPYQIVESTARLKKFNLKVDDKYDERLDPLKSAELCAAHLADNHKRFGEKDDNWDLSLLAYNGGYVDEFLKSLSKKELSLPEKEISIRQTHYLEKGKTLYAVADHFKTSLPLLYRANADPKISYPAWLENMKNIRPGNIKIPQERKFSLEDFYHWLEETINAKIQSELDNDSYTIKKGDTLKEIAKKFAIDPDLLKSLNPPLNYRPIKAGKTLHIPKTYKSNSAYLLEILSGFKENINYPGKFHAFYRIIQDNHLVPSVENFKPVFSKIELDRKISLFGLSREKKISLSDLERLNPAIKDSYYLILPRGTELRVLNR